MSRIAKNPITLPKGVEVKLNGQDVAVKGGKGELSFTVHKSVAVAQEDGSVTVNSPDGKSWAMAGTMRSLINNMVVGCSEGFEKKLELRGVGYRAQAKGKVLDLTLGFSHPVQFEVPEGLQITTPSQTEVVVSGIDKQRVGQAAAKIRAFRPPEPYKGKGVRYLGEYVAMKEGKKK